MGTGTYTGTGTGTTKTLGKASSIKKKNKINLKVRVPDFNRVLIQHKKNKENYWLAYAFTSLSFTISCLCSTRHPFVLHQWLAEQGFVLQALWGRGKMCFQLFIWSWLFVGSWLLIWYAGLRDRNIISKFIDFSFFSVKKGTYYACTRNPQACPGCKFLYTLIRVDKHSNDVHRRDKTWNNSSLIHLGSFTCFAI